MRAPIGSHFRSTLLTDQRPDCRHIGGCGGAAGGRVAWVGAVLPCCCGAAAEGTGHGRVGPSGAADSGKAGLLWVVVGCYGLLWVAMGCCGLQWVAMGCYGLKWVAMGCYGLLWIAAPPSCLRCPLLVEPPWANPPINFFFFCASAYLCPRFQTADGGL